MKEKIWAIIKKHHLHHYGNVDLAVEELANLFEDGLKSRDSAGKNGEIPIWKQDLSFCIRCGEKPKNCKCED